MFWKIFFELCEAHKTKPLRVVKEIGISSGSITKWKNGAIPSGQSLNKIADYFGVSVDYLLGKEGADPSPENRHSITIRGRDGSVIESDLTDEQIELITRMVEQFKGK